MNRNVISTDISETNNPNELTAVHGKELVCQLLLFWLSCLHNASLPSLRHPKANYTIASDDFQAHKTSKCAFLVTWIYYLLEEHKNNKVKAFIVPRAIREVSSLLFSSRYWIFMTLRDWAKVVTWWRRRSSSSPPTPALGFLLLPFCIEYNHQVWKATPTSLLNSFFHTRKLECC